MICYAVPPNEMIRGPLRSRTEDEKLHFFEMPTPGHWGEGEEGGERSLVFLPSFALAEVAFRFRSLQ